MKELTTTDIEKEIYQLPNRPAFMLANALASIYEVKPKRIGEAVKRNPRRFPSDFCFRLEKREVDILRSQNATAVDHRSQNVTGAKMVPIIQHNNQFNPLAFTRSGANQLSAVLKSDKAAERSVMIMRAFSAIEERLERMAKTKMEPEDSFAADIFRYFNPNYRPAPQLPAALPEKTIPLQDWAALQEERAELYRFKCETLAAGTKRRYRAITPSERAEIIALKKAGMANCKIAEKVGRGKPSIRTILREAGFPPERGCVA